MAGESPEQIELRVQELNNLLMGQIEDENIETHLLAREGLLDTLCTLYEECTHSHMIKNKYVASFVKKYSATISKLRKLRIKATDFEVKDVIGRGHFGEVQVVREKFSGTVYAMKILRKNETLAQQELSFFEEERDIMATSCSPWITQLHYAFQDSSSLYLVMEFHAGGDLLSLLSRYDDVFEEGMAKFYLAEMTEAVHSLHMMGYVHRDIKPENILIDCGGHVKLADFGSAAKLSLDMLVSSRMPVGTPDYVSPELLTSMNNHHMNSNYGVEVDWWSLGICMYEMLFAKTPFTDENSSMVMTYSNIMNYKKCLKFPSDTNVSTEAMSMIKQLLIDKDKRLEYHQMLKHPFFTGINWQILREETPPFVPHLASLDDTSNFEEFEKLKHQPCLEDFQKHADFSGRDLPFVGFTYVKEQIHNENEDSVSFIENKHEKNVTAIETDIKTSGDHANANLEVTLTVKVAELQRLRDQCRKLEESECALKQELNKSKREATETNQELTRILLDKEAIEKNLDLYVTKSNTLGKDLSLSVEEKDRLEWEAETIFVQIQNLSAKVREIEEEMLRNQLLELEEQVIQVEAEKQALRNKLSHRDQQLDKSQQQQSAMQSQLTELQRRLDKERRKSRDDQKRDLVLLESREDMWNSQLQQQSAEIRELKLKVQEFEDLTEAYELQEKDYMEREQQLIKKMKEQNKVQLQVKVRTEASPKANGTSAERIIELENLLEQQIESGRELEQQREEMEELIEKRDMELSECHMREDELEERIDKLEEHRDEWKKREAACKDQIEKLTLELDSQKQQNKISTVTKSKLMEQVQMYQAEVNNQREKLKMIQEDVKLCLEEDNKSKHQEYLERRIKDVEEQGEILRDDKKKLQKEIVRYQHNADENEFKISDQERTIQRLNTKLDRMERQWSEAKDRETDLRFQKKDSGDIKFRVAEQQMTYLRQEKLSLEGKVERLVKELQDVHPIPKSPTSPGLSRLQTENDRLSHKNEFLQKEIDQIQKTLQQSRKECVRLKDELSEKESSQKMLEKLHSQKEMNRLDNELKIANRKIKQLESDVEEAERKSDKFENELKEYKKEKRESKDKNVDNNFEIISSNEKVNKIEFEISRKSTDLKELFELRQENVALHSKIESLEKESKHSREFNDLRMEKQSLEGRVNNLEKELDNMKSSSNRRWKSLENVEDLKQEKRYLDTKSKELQKQHEQHISRIELLEKQLRDKNYSNEKCEELEKEITILTTEKRKLEEQLDKIKTEKQNQVESLEKEIERLRRNSTLKQNQLENVEDLKQEKNFLETKIDGLELQISQQKQQIQTLERGITDAKESSDQVVVLKEEIEKLKDEKRSLELELEKVEREKNQSPVKPPITFLLEDKLQKEKAHCDKTLTDIQKELHESNLALSEARSLLAASERQERELKERMESEIRDLKLRLHCAENGKDLESEKVMNTCQRTQSENQELGLELKLTKSQHEKLVRESKALEEKVSALQKEKGSLAMEKHMLKDSLLQKTHQCESDAQKLEKLRVVCAELEAQIKDLEVLSDEYERREQEWNDIRKSYEHAVNEREEELEGTSQQLNVIQQARTYADQSIGKMQEQMRKSKAVHKADIEALNHQVWEAKRITSKFQEQIDDLKEKNSKMQVVLERQKQTLKADLEEKRVLKEEISDVLTESQNLKMKNLKLKQNLDEAMGKFELIFGEKVDLENFAEALQGLHFLEKYKFESTIGQQMKLIDYLQVLYSENSGKKKKSGKLFGSNKQKESINAIVPMPQDDLQGSLELERKRNARLMEQNDELRKENFKQANELLKLKGPLKEKVDNCLTPNVQAAMSVLSRSPASQNTPVALLTPSIKRSAQNLNTPQPQPTSQRMHHNIPHRFVTGLNTRATKCAVCLGSVQFVKQAAKCQECGTVCHPKCLTSVPANCGLPSEYIQHFTGIMSKLKRQSVGSGRYSPVSSDVSPIQMQGYLKVPRTGKTAWDRRWASLESNILLMYYHENDANPVDTFDLNPAETDVMIHSAVSTAELPSTASTDLPYVIRLEHEPLTTCWPGRVLYLMVPTFPEKQRWVACLEAGIKNLQKHDTVPRNKLQMSSLLEMSGDRRLDLNCAQVLSNELTVLGAEDGLYGVNVHNKQHSAVRKLTGFGSVYQLAYTPSLNVVVMITDRDRKLKWVEKKVIKLKLDQTSGAETTYVPHDTIEGLQGCTVFDLAEWQNGVFLCVGMTTKITLLKYNPELRLFCVRKEFNIVEPCSCICISENFAVVGTEKFYQINLDHPNMTEFVDKRDNSLAFAAFGAAIHNSFPLAVVNVSPNGLPLEFLLCFHEFGVFVDSKGRRSRPGDMKWTCLPLSFAYNEPFLYVTYFNSVQAITIPADKTETRGKQTSVDIQGPRYLGAALNSGTVYVACSHNYGTEMLCVRGNDGSITDYFESDKENRPGSWAPERNIPVKLVPPKVIGERLSLTSLDSNTSSSTWTTMTSTDDLSSTSTDV